MDSKSISREGVGVQVPASAPASAGASDEFSRALLRVVLHDLANATQYLTTLDTLLQLGDLDGSNRLAGLMETSQDVEEIGFVLGLVAYGAGAEVLHDRARRDGLDVMARWVRRALRREGRDLDVEGARRVRVRVDGPDRGRRVTWAAGRFLFSAARALPPNGRLALGYESHEDRVRLVCGVGADAALEHCARELQADDARCSVLLDAAACSLTFPPGALELDAR